MRAPVRVLAVQTLIREASSDPIQRERAVTHNLYRSIALVDKAVQRSGRPDIVVLPEFFLQGYASTRTHTDALAVGLTVPGRETDALGALAAEHRCYVAGAVWEVSPAWPDRFFNTAFIVGPSGRVELTYRKLYDGNYQAGFTGTTPGDVFDEYVARHGEDALFPVLGTEFGNLACVICYDLLFPETVRRLALRGAEIICNPTGEVNGAYLDVWESARRARAAENQVFWVSANHGGFEPALTHATNAGADVPTWFTNRVPGGITATSPSQGRSEILDYRGQVIAGLSVTGEATLDGFLDVDALRAARARAVVDGLPVASTITAGQAHAFADGYARAPGFPLNRLAAEPLHDVADGTRHLAAVVAALRGTTIVPDAMAAVAEPAVVLAYQADIPFFRPATDADADPDMVVDREDYDTQVTIAIREHIGATCVAVGAELRRTRASMVVMPDSWPLGFAASDDAFDAHVGLDLHGRPFTLVRDFAETLETWLVGSCLVRTPTGPARAGWVIDPTGAVVHTRCAFGPAARGHEPAVATEPPCDANPFPVLDTPFGRLGIAVGRELMSVEIVRLLTAAGAEIIANPAAEFDVSVVGMTDHMRRARASENLVYIVSAAPGRLLGGLVAEHAACGTSAVVDFAGDIVVSIAAGITAGAAARLDLARLRGRRSFGPGNCLVQLRPQLYPAGYRALT